jgi:alkylation response protein AidB-like acyl-CoA dehydrogenase
MDLTFSPSQERFRTEVRAWLADHVAGPEPTGEREMFEHRRAFQRRLHAAGWAGLSWPHEFGGRGASLIEEAILNEELAHAKAPFTANVVGITMAGPTLMAHGTHEQKSRYLAPILSADEIWCQGFSEPDAGSDLAALRTRATPTQDGWTVTGQKVWTSFAQYAKWCLLLVRTGSQESRHRGLTFLLLDMQTPGVTVRPLPQMTGEAEFNELFLDDVVVPREQLVGEVDRGWAVALSTLNAERAGLAFGLQVTLKSFVDELTEAARDAGRLEDSELCARLGDLHARTELLRLTAYRGLSTQLETGRPGPEGSLTKWMWSETNQRATELAVDVLGASALTRGSRWAHELLRARANSIEGGTTEIAKNVIAERVLGLPRMR